MGAQEKLQLKQYTLDHFFERVVDIYGHTTSIGQVGQTPITYAELGEKVTQLQTELRNRGVKYQDKVVIFGNSTSNWAIAFLAVATMGAVAVPVMDEFPEADVEHILGHSEAVAIFIEESLHQSLNLPSLDDIPLIIKLDDFSFTGKKSDPAANFRSHLPEKIKQSLGSVDKEAESIQEDDLAEILYTSGTTGHSKGVMLTHKNLTTNLLTGTDIFEFLGEDSVILGILPLAHSFGLNTTLLAMMSVGATIYYLDKKPSPKVLMKAMQEVRPHSMGAVPLIFEKIYQRQVVPAINGNRLFRLMVKAPPLKRMLHKIIGKKLLQAFGGRIQGFFIGGASLNQELEMFMQSAGIPYSLGYGLSECSPIVTGAKLEFVKIGCVGPTVKDVFVKIDNPDPETGVGEIFIKGPNVMQGYYKNKAATDAVFTEDGWLITGDRGCLDEDNFLYIKGRSKNMILGSSGENIYPEVIEDKLKESVFVEEALVYLLDNKLTARIYPNYTYIETLQKNREEAVLAADVVEILERVRQETNTRLPTFSQIQQVVEQTSPFIKTPTNKIKRGEYIPDYFSSQ
jgi:long-chain acyl-CoA synthetase